MARPRRARCGQPKPHKHTFQGYDQALFDATDDGRRWPLRAVQCSGCGETRIVSFFLDPSTIQ